MSFQRVPEEVKAEIVSLNREVGLNEGKITMLEQEKARIQADLDSERKKVEQLRTEVATHTIPQPQVRLRF